MLNHCRVLDLTDDKGFLCGKILGDLGADVIKVEPPGGIPDRNIGPFYNDIPHPEKSLYWVRLTQQWLGLCYIMVIEELNMKWKRKVSPLGQLFP